MLLHGKVIRGLDILNKVFWVSCRLFTVRVEVRDNIIVNAAPVVKRFQGQPFNNLKRWMAKFGKFRVLALVQDITHRGRL